MKRTVLVGVTSGIAAYKALELVASLKKENLDVSVIMSSNATKMVPLGEFEQASGAKVFTDLFEPGFDYKHILKSRKVDHIDVADRADVMVILPATANIIGKIAYGIADDFLTTTALAVTAPVIVCPSMNVNMWNNPVVQENVSKLKTQGYQIVEPSEGMLACGYEGKGRLEDIPIIKEEVMHQLHRTKSLAGKRIIITAGGTQEKIDEVRFIANKSSGKMGIAIAEECYMRGAQVLLLRANSSVKPRYIIPEETFDTVDELQKKIKKHISRCDIFFHVAAVSDFRLEQHNGKLSSKGPVNLELEPRSKIVDRIKKLNPAIHLIAFKAEIGLGEVQLVRAAHNKLKECGADAIIANDVGAKDRGFQAATNEVFIVLGNGTYKKIPLRSKRDVAAAALDFISEQLHF